MKMSGRYIKNQLNFTLCHLSWPIYSNLIVGNYNNDLCYHNNINSVKLQNKTDWIYEYYFETWSDSLLTVSVTNVKRTMQDMKTIITVWKQTETVLSMRDTSLDGRRQENCEIRIAMEYYLCTLCSIIIMIMTGQIALNWNKQRLSHTNYVLTWYYFSLLIT